jgi:hypothetical protein
MESLNDVKNVLHGSYDHALRTGDLLVFSATEYEKMLAKIDGFFDHQRAADEVAYHAPKIQVPEKKEITDQKVRDALGLDKVDKDKGSHDEVVNIKGSNSDDVASLPGEETVTEKSLETRSETSEMDNLPEDDPNLSSEDVSQTPEVPKVPRLKAVAVIKDNEAENSSESNDEFENTDSADFDAGSLLNAEHDKLVEKNQSEYHAEDFAKSEDVEIQPTAKSENVADGTSVQEPFFK